MEAFSDLLLNLYRQAQIVSPKDFQTRSLDVIRGALAFDSAIWATGAITSEGAIVHTVCVYRQPPDMMKNYERIKQHDALLYEAFNRLGQTINVALTTDPSWQSRLHPDAMAHAKRYGMEHVLSTHIAEPVLRLFTAVSFYRANPEHPFTETERLFKQNLISHLAESWNTNRLNSVLSYNKGSIPLGQVCALCDKKGVIYNASKHFDEFVLSEWPDWHGPQLPNALLDILTDKMQRRYIGNVVVVTIKMLNNMLLLNLRKKSSVDQLSSREMDVAKRFGHGSDFRKIAEELHISPNTVRNHLKAIYSKLGINNKAEMVHIILEVED